ncbi:hypothetical protein B0T22DRAFT_147775 [Podospora appendiculata]|uniref:Thiaminase-2/PQQC domain-containing protein n=1 Tax=Podospora appendiculata TaxID=314037 RepID=A0AAE0X8U1_9PEZI|nr:hypothetical protein B0T22DRAFT_147775 [Podospora appendiculata]
MASSPSWSLTEHLLSTFQSEFQSATQHGFLLAAAEGRLPKETLGRWLANDRLYIHSYIRGAGKLLASLDLPQHVPAADTEAVETQLVDWLIEALAAVRKEERFFLDVAERYGLSIAVETSDPSQVHGSREIGFQVSNDAKILGLVMIEDIFSGIQPATAEQQALLTVASERPPPPLLPWLEGAVVFWGTERCYLDAWSWARSKQPLGRDTRDDADGGALRKEFIPNWSGLDFARFVGRLGSLIDFAVGQALDRAGDRAEEVKGEILTRLEGKWKSLLAAEAAFWPEVEG